MESAIRAILAHKGSAIRSVSPDTTVFAAVERMNDHHVGALLVTADANRLLGIFTERDVMVRVIARELDPKVTPVGEVMTRTVVTLPIAATIETAMRTITEKRCRHLPVLDGDKLAGVISIGDVMGWLVRDQQRTIDDLNDYVRRT
jgi:CBS domain-containing protein